MARPARYYKRRRALPVLGPEGTIGETVEALTTRYYFGVKRRKPHNIYYRGGTWYRTRATPTMLDASGSPLEWTHAFEPIDHADAWDRFLSQTLEQGKAAPVTVHIRQGRLVSAVGAPGTEFEGVELLDGTEPADAVEDLLDLIPTERRRPGKAA